jgi:hypothetical protein
LYGRKILFTDIYYNRSAYTVTHKSPYRTLKKSYSSANTAARIFRTHFEVANKISRELETNTGGTYQHANKVTNIKPNGNKMVPRS